MEHRAVLDIASEVSSADVRSVILVLVEAKSRRRSIRWRNDMALDAVRVEDRFDVWLIRRKVGDVLG
jgi:hypothetical protein